MTTKVYFGEVTNKLWGILRFIILLGLGYIILYPVLFMLSTAFRPVDQLTDPSVIWVPKTFTLENFTLSIKAMDYLNALKNTVLVGGISSILQILSCACAGYGFARFKFKEKGILFALVIFTIIVPPMTKAVPDFLLYRNFLNMFNLINNPLSLYLPAALGVGLRSGLYIFVFRQFFRAIPKELEEAATVDGCGYLKTFVKIMIPNAGGAFLTVFLFSIVWYWNDFFTTSMLLSGAKYTTLSVALTTLKSELQNIGVSGTDPFVIAAKLQAGALISIAPLLIMYIFLQKYFTESIERTGIVG